MFQGSAIHAPNHPDAHIEVPKSLAKQHFALLKDQGVPLFTPQHHNPMVPTMHPAEKSSSAALSMPMMVPQTLSHQSRTSAPPTPSHQLRGLAPPTPSPAPRTQQSQHSALKLSPRSQKSFPKPLPKPPQVDGPAPPLARSTKNGNSKHGSSDAEGAPPLKKQCLGAPKAIKSLGSKGIGDKNSKNKMTPHPKTSRVNVQSTTKAQEPGDEPGSDRKHSSRMMNPDYHHSFVAKH
ncbi:hypothetical protein BDN72DRAFT_839293 [Pluteus cervinus]|uniref:Uncharacterized protein n=1 Tax=Pluteus cervinus TaxID=181527 RepID=A0ACD3AWX2_9AGAR|nr:hypothetical protein BDN72DRAFT_839293 [Pluteus cervinus]